MKRFTNVLCVVESDKACAPALQRAVALAESNQASLVVIDVAPRITAGIRMPDGGPISAELQSALVDSRTRKLETLVEPYRKRTMIETRVLVGTPFLEIIYEVLRRKHDLVIKIPEQQVWLERWFGSDDMHLLRKCPCPVWLIKPQEPKAYRRILAAVDVDEAYPPEELESRQALNRQILEMASSLALAESSDLHIVHAWSAFGESSMRHGAFMSAPEEKVAAYVEQVRRQHAASLDALMGVAANYVGEDALDYLKPSKHLVKGRARQEIPALAKRIDADLIIMGTVARTGVPGFFMGNTAETILNQIDCSVLAIKPPGFVTPVRLDD